MRFTAPTAGLIILLIPCCLNQAFSPTPKESRWIGYRLLLSSASDEDMGPPVIQNVTGVTLKIAFDSSSCWGISDLSSSKSERFTSPPSLDMVHRLRAVSDCILVGRGTVSADDCTLTVRRGAERILEASRRPQPTRVVVDPSLKLFKECTEAGAEYSMFKDGLPVIVYHCMPPYQISVRVIEFMSSHPDIQLAYAPSLHDGVISPRSIADDLFRSKGIRHIMVEGGASTAKAFLREGQVDRAIIVRAPIRFQEPLASDIDEGTLTDAGLVKLGSVGGDGDDTFDGDTVDYWVKEGEAWIVKELSEWP